MSARKKLNSAYVVGSLVLSGVVGLMTESWIAFFILLALSLASNFYEGNIRPNSRHHREGNSWKRQH